MEEGETRIWHRLPSEILPTLDCPQPSHGYMRMLSSHCKAVFKRQIFPRAAHSASASTFSEGSVSPGVLRAGALYSLCPEGLNAGRSGLENERRTVFGNSSLVGQAAVALQDAGLEKEGGRVAISARQLAALPGAAGTNKLVAMRHSCSVQVSAASPDPPSGLPGALIGSAGGTVLGLGAGWETGPSPCSGERKEAVGRGGAEGERALLLAESSLWGFWAGCPKVEEVLRFSSCPGNGEGSGQFAACGGRGVWMCRVGRVCCSWGGPACCHLGAEQAGVRKISGLFWKAF